VGKRKTPAGGDKPAKKKSEEQAEDLDARAIVTREASPVSARTEPQAQPVVWTRERVELLKRTICKDATDDELAMFLELCKRTQLDPFARQIHAIKRKNYKDGEWQETMTFMVGIDGFRLTAQRSREYCGQVGPQWCAPDGRWRDVWLETYPPAAARVGILRRGFTEPVWGVAVWKEYAPYYKDKKSGEWRLTKMWENMSSGQLAKCAEALGLRRAFPQELSGLYSLEEMDQAKVRDVEGSPALPPREPQAQLPPQAAFDPLAAVARILPKTVADLPKNPTVEEIKDARRFARAALADRVKAAMKILGWTKPDLDAHVKAGNTGRDTWEALNLEGAETVTTALETQAGEASK
jgi:phage recombination protein Bet